MSDKSDKNQPSDPFKPYKGRFESYSSIPAKGRTKDSILNELATIAAEENARWETGQVSGTLYHAGKEHREFLNKVFAFFSHVNTLQLDLCPSMFKMESEIITMTANMLHADAVKDVDSQDTVCGTVTSGGSESLAELRRATAEKGGKIFRSPIIVWRLITS